MRENFSVEEILEAVDSLLDTKIEETFYKKDNILPIDTEKIISQAELYIKKK